MILKPLPDKETFENEIYAIFENGDIGDIAAYLQHDRSSLSRMVNPGALDRHNPVWLTLGIAWAFDAKGRPDKADRILNPILRERSIWTPASVVQADPAKTSGHLGRELMELFEKEMAGATKAELLKEAQDVKAAIEAKIEEILARPN